MRSVLRITGQARAAPFGVPKCTRGIDIGAKAEIYQIIHNLAASGIAVIVVSSDLMEVMGISDRILVLCEGALRGEIGRDQANESNLLQLALPRHRADGVAN